LMAPPALPLAQISLQQVLAAVAPAQRPAMKAKELAALENMRHAHDSKDAWYRSSLDVDPVTDIARVRAPILIVQGAADVQVLPADLPRLTKAARAANHDVTVRTFPNDNHLFEAITPGVTQTPFIALNQYLTVPARIDARVLDTLVSWLAHHIR
jgi:uncharacterized protein